MSDNTDAFSYELHNSKDGRGWVIEVTDPCPHCGNDTVFSGNITEKAQYVSHSIDDVDTDNPVLGADDVMSVEVGYLNCNKCDTNLVENGEIQ